MDAKREWHEVVGPGEKASRALTPSKKPEIELFLDAATRLPRPAAARRGRLIFAFDATMSRQATWDLAQKVQGKMFETAAAHGGLDVQLVYYRGFLECKASRFVGAGQSLAGLMSTLFVEAGETQIEKVLRHAHDETRREKVDVLVFVGDAMEEEQDVLAARAAELGLAQVKCFMFQEGRDKAAEQAFRKIALLTGGAYATFDLSAPDRLAGLLAAAAAYAAGGRRALELESRMRGTQAAGLLLEQLR
jgi:hypothetical protein